jgi:tRNA(fMet)-specific endonuclease VapC
MRILLDTSAYSAFMRGHDEIRAVVRTNEDIFLNSVVVGELMAGFIKGGRRKKNEEELRRFLTSPRVSLVDVGEETAERYAVILNSLWQAGTPIPTNDIWIAASAMEYGLRVVTTDEHYDKIPQIMVDYFAVK